MNQEDISREFEKAAKSLSKMRGKEVLFEEDASDGRARIVYDAMNGNLASLREIAREIVNQPEGGRHIVRALNNVKVIGHEGMLCFTEAAFEALENVDVPEQITQKFIQLLDAVSIDLRDGLGWMDAKAVQMMTAFSKNSEIALELWMHWCAATIRVCPTANTLIELVGTHRPLNLPKSVIHQLKDSLSDEQNIAWDSRGAALYLLLGNRQISLEFAQDYVDKAYVSFPLEALEGVEILALAVENDGTQYAEFEVIQDKLAQIRRDNLYLNEMPLDDFVTTSLEVMKKLENMPKSELDLALSLQRMSKNERMILSAFLDDVRRSEFFKLARKSGRMKEISKEFFKYFDAENPILRNFSLSLVTSLMENENVDAQLTEIWIDACENEDLSQLKCESEKWITLVLSH